MHRSLNYKAMFEKGMETGGHICDFIDTSAVEILAENTAVIFCVRALIKVLMICHALIDTETMEKVFN